MSKELKGLEFDPGFAPHILVFKGTIDYLYMDINRFKNFTQKKMKFMQYHKKFIEILYNNLGFYVGCLMWASYIKTQPKQEILNNSCFGQEYNEQENIADTQFIIHFIELFPKDMKYFLTKDFSFDESLKKLVQVYEEFLVLNKGFVNTKYNTDIEIPASIKTEKAETFCDKINTILTTGDLSKLLNHLSEIL